MFRQTDTTTEAMFPLYRIAFHSGGKSTYPIRNVQLSEAERNNISPLHNSSENGVPERYG